MEVPPNNVIMWLASIGFKPLKPDALADTIQILDRVKPSNLSFVYHPHGVPDMVATATVPMSVLNWYRTDGAEAELAQLYLHGSKE